MSGITNTKFGKNKTFVEIERCDELTSTEAHALSEITGEQVTRTLMDMKPRPMCHATDTDILLVLRGVNLNPNSDPEDMIAVRAWISDDKIVVSQRRPVVSVDAVQGRLNTIKTPVEAMLSITDEMFDRIERYIFELDEAVDAAEDKALADPNKKQRLEILEFRRSVIALRRYLLPQRESMMTLSRSKSKLLNQDDIQIITDQYFRSARITDQLDALRERLSLIQEEITAIISDQINQNMYVLSIISLIFLPLGFLTGLFGINVGGMPAVAGGGSPYEPYAFWFVVAGCVITAVTIAVVMRIKKWI